MRGSGRERESENREEREQRERTEKIVQSYQHNRICVRWSGLGWVEGEGGGGGRGEEGGREIDRE